jgi:hypothetical protein
VHGNLRPVIALLGAERPHPKISWPVTRCLAAGTARGWCGDRVDVRSHEDCTQKRNSEVSSRSKRLGKGSPRTCVSLPWSSRHDWVSRAVVFSCPESAKHGIPHQLGPRSRRGLGAISSSSGWGGQKYFAGLDAVAVTGRAAEQEGVFEPLFILHTVAQHHLTLLWVSKQEALGALGKNPLPL